jgi:uncharacterized protein (TIGR02996 family)
MTQLRQALEEALVENPDDLAAHSAYADYLMEQGDPRGELIQTQLALEKPGLARDERARLQARERSLLGELREAILGKELAILLDARGYARPRSRIERGWLTAITTEGGLDADLINALICAPEARLLRELAVQFLSAEMYRSPDAPDEVELLSRGKNLSNLRILRLGTIEGFADIQEDPKVYNARWELYEAGDLLWRWLAALPRLEELSLECRTRNTEHLFSLPSLSNLRVLQVSLTDDYPLDALARNAALTRLTHLALHPLAATQDEEEGPYLHAWHLATLARSPHLRALTHLRFQKSDAGDEGVRALIDSGLLARLRFLDLAMGTITDEGAAVLATADTGKLEVLDVSQNALSPAGQEQIGRALKKKLNLRMDRQSNAPNPEWLYWGEME